MLRSQGDLFAGAGREAGSASPMHYKTRELKRSAQAVLGAFSFLMGPDSSVGPRFEPWCQPATDSSLAEKPFLRPFLACGGLLFPVSARRHRLQAPLGAPVSGGKNPVPNSKRAG